MPLITNDKTKSPYLSYQGPVIPNYGELERYEKLGSSDTILGRMFGNYYDRAFIPELSQADQRYYNQGNLNAFLSNAFKLGAAVPAGILGLANVVGTAATPLGWTYMAQNDASFLEALEKNPLGQLYNGWKGFYNSLSPVFAREDFNKASFLEQLGRPGELLSANTETFQFLAEMFSTAGAMGALKVGTRAANYLARNKPLYKALTSLEGPNVARLAGQIDNLTTSSVLAAGEASSEALDLYDQQTRKLYQERLEGLNNLTDEEINSKADEAAKNVFWENMATLAITNHAFMSLVKPLFRSGEKLSRGNKYGVLFKNGQYELPKYATDKASKFERFWMDKGYTPGVVTKTLLENVFSEGLEESLQYNIQKINELDKSLSSDTSLLGSFGRYLSSLPSTLDLGDPDRLKAAGLGALIGGGQVGVTSIIDALNSDLDLGPVAESTTFRKNRDEAITNLNKSYTDYFTTNVLKKTPDKKGRLYTKEDENGIKFYNEVDGAAEQINQQDYVNLTERYNIDPAKGGQYTIKGEFELDANGKPIRDPQKFEALTKDAIKFGELDDLIEQESLRTNPDLIKLELLEKEKLSLLAYQGFQSGTTDLLLEKLDMLKNSSQEELLAAGMDPAEDITAKIDSMTTHVIELEKLWNTVQNSTLIASNSIEEHEKNAKRKQFLYSTGARALTLDNLNRKLTAEFENGVAEFDPNNELQGVLKTLFDLHYLETDLEQLFAKRASYESDVISRQLNKEVIDSLDEEIKAKLDKRKTLYEASDYPTFRQIASDTRAEKLTQLANNKRFIETARENLGKTFDKYLHTRTGFESFVKDTNKTYKPVLTFDRGVEKLIVSSKLTKDAYDFFESRKIIKEAFKEKVNRTSKEFYSEYVDSFVRWFEDNFKREDGESVVTLARNLSQLYTDIMAASPRMYEDAVDKLEDLAVRLNDLVTELEAPIVTRANAVGETPDNFIDFADTELESSEMDEFFKDLKDYKQASEIKEALGVIRTDPNAFNSLRSLVGGPTPLSTDDELKEKVALSFLDASDVIAKASGYTDGQVNEMYTDDVSVIYEIEKLTNLLPIIRQKDNELKSSIEDEYMAALEMLNYILDKVKANKLNRAVKEKEENILYALATLENVGINTSAGTFDETNPIIRHLLNSVERATLSLVAQTASTDPVMATKAISDLLQSATDEDNSDTRVILSELQDNLVRSIKTLLTETFKDIKISDDELVSLAKSPARVFKHILSKALFAELKSTRFNSPDIKQFIQSYDLVTLVRSRKPVTESGLANPDYVDRSKASLNNGKFDQLLDMYLALVSFSRLERHISSTVTNADMLEGHIKHGLLQQKSTKPKPVASTGQERIIAELVDFFTSEVEPTYEVNKNIAALKAPPGAGKSQVITPLVLRLASLEPTEVIASASTAGAAANIATSIGTTSSMTLIQLIDALENNQISPQVKVIIVDELGQASYELIDRLSRAFAKYNRTNTAKTPLKMLYIYDPNQSTAGYKAVPDIEEIGYNIPRDADTPQTLQAAKEGNYSLGGYLVFTQNLYDVSTIRTTYRSDVAPIVDLFSQFAANTSTVSDVRASSSVDPRVTTKNIMGTFVEADPKSLTSILTKSILENPDRTRVVIVGNDSRKALLRSELDKLGLSTSVSTVREVQGQTFDEVYVDIKVTDSPNEYPHLYETPTNYNKDINTAISRAALFAYVAGISGSNQVDADITIKAAASAATKKVDYDEYVKSKKEELAVLKKLTGDKIGSKALPVAPTEEAEEIEVPVIEAPEAVQVQPPVLDNTLEDELIQLDDEVSEDESFTSPAIPITIPMEGEVTFTLQYPSNTAFTDLANSPKLKPGDNLILVKDTYKPSVKGGYKERILVLRPDGGGLYRMVGVLSDNERPLVEKKLGINFDNLKGLEFPPQGEYQVAYDNELLAGEFIPLYATNDVSGLTYYYESGEPTALLDSEKKILSVFNLWAGTLLGPNYKNIIENYDDIIKDPAKYLYFKVFSSNSKIIKFFKGRKAPRILPLLNVPYLVLENIKLTTDLQPLTPQFIRASSTVLNRSHSIVEATNSNGERVSLGMDTLETFVETIEAFHDELDKHKSLGTYSKVRMGLPYQTADGKILKDTNGNPFYVFHALIKALSEQYKSKGTSPIKILGHGKDNSDIKNLSDTIKNKFPDIDPASLSARLLELAASIDSLQHFGDSQAIASGSVKAGSARNFSGHAQLVLNKLALSNFFLTINDTTGATPLILRDYQVNYVDKKPISTISAKRLLGPVTAVRGNKAYNPLIKESILKKLSRYATSLEARGRSGSLRYKLATELISKVESGSYDVQAVPLTLSQLKAIVYGFDKKTGNYTQINEGFGLRAPITYYSVGEDDFVKADYRLGTSFWGVSPTRITVGTVKQEAIQQVPKTKPEPNIEQFIQLNAGTMSLSELEGHISSKFSKAEQEIFLAKLKTSSLQTAVEEYVRGASNSQVLRRLGVSLKKTVKNLLAVLTISNSSEEALKTLYEDPSYWKEDSKSKFGPRDTVRLAILLKILPNIQDVDKLGQAATYFAQNRWYRKEELADLVENTDSAVKALIEFTSAATRVAKGYGIDVTEPQVVDNEGNINISAAVEYIAEVIGSQVRASAKAAAVPIMLNEQLWASELAYMAYNHPEQLATYVKETEGVAAALGITIEGTTDEYVTQKAIEAVMENNLQPTRSMTLSKEDIGPLLTDEEVADMYERIIPSNRLSTISKIFRSKRGESYRIITLNEMIHGLGKENWGLYKNGIIYLARDPKTDKVGAKVVRHEAMHHIIWGYLSPSDRLKLFNLGRERFGDLPVDLLEERIVDSYVDGEYQKPESFWDKVRDILNRIMRFIGFTYNNLTSLDAFFNSVDAKYYAGKGRQVSIERNMKLVKDWAIKDATIQQEYPDFGPLEAYTLFEDLLFGTFQTIYTDRKLDQTAPLVSFEQAIEDSFNYLASVYNNPEQLADYGDTKLIKAALAPIVDKNSSARRAVMDEFFPQTREAEKLALALADLRERYEALYEELSELVSADTGEDDLVADIEEQLEEFRKEIGIKEELFETELRNPSTKLTGRVKQRLSGIEYLNKGQVTRVEFAKVFNVLLNTITQVDNLDIYSYMDRVLSTFSKRYPIRGGATHQRSVGKALHAYLRNVFNQFDRWSSEAPVNLSFRKDTSNLVEYVVFSKDLSSARNITRSEAILNPSRYVVIDKAEQESLDSFAQRLVDNYGFDYNAIRKAYYLYEETAFITSLISAVSSLRENVPTVGITYYNWGAKTERYYGIRKSGPNYILESDLLAYTDDFIENLRRTDATTPLSSNPEDYNYIDLPLPDSRGEGASDRKIGAINKFLDLINLNTDKRLPANIWSEAELSLNYENFYYAIQNLKDNFLAEPSDDDRDIYGDLIKYRPTGSILADETSMLRSISHALADLMSATETVSYRRGDGKQAYRYIDASFQSALLNTLTNVIGDTVSFDHVTKEANGNLKATGPLVKNNLFVNNNFPAASIKSFIDHDSMKTYGRDKFARYLRSERAIDFDMRNFSFGFLSVVKNKRGSSYVQFLPVPSERSSMQGVEVSLLKGKQLELAAKHIIRSELTRPSPKEAGLENNAAYVNNWNMLTFPGLVTDSGFALSRDTLMKGRNIKEAVEFAYSIFTKHMNGQIENIVSEIISNNLQLDERNLKYVASLTGLNVDKLSRKEYLTTRRKVLRGELDPSRLEVAEKVYNEQFHNALTAAVKLFYPNFVINQYALSNLLYGDAALYASKEDQTKRLKIATATGDMGLIDDTYGMPKESRVAVIEDLVLGIPIDLSYVRDDSFGEEYKSTDGQGYVLPEFYEKMSQAYSIESKLDITLKPVYYSINAKGEVVALKYSLAVLTDELVANNSFLRNLRDAMRNNVDSNGLPAPVDQAVFNSAMKVGNPLKKNLSKIDPRTSYITDSKGKRGFSPESIVTINNKFLKIQLNPAKTTDASTSNPSQGTAFINTNGLNTAEASKLHTLNSKLIELGLKSVMRELEINAKGTLSKNSVLAIRKRLISMTDNLPGAEDINELLSYKQNGTYGVSLDVPLLGKKDTAALASLVTKSTVGFRFPGSKLVLQADVGLSEQLAWKDEEGYTEVLMPSTMRDVLRIGDVVSDGLVAFRIPSTNFHSMLALKVKGFYEVPVGSKGNIIIAPSMIVHYHGSDYDIDTLFLIRKRQHTDGHVNIASILSKYDGKYENADYLSFESNDVYGFKEGTPTDITSRLYDAIELIEKTLGTIRKDVRGTRGDERKSSIDLLKDIESDYFKVVEYTQYIVQNQIVDLFSKTLRDEKNRQDLLTPISFGRISNNKASLIEELDNNFDYYIDLLKKHGEVDSLKYC